MSAARRVGPAAAAVLAIDLSAAMLNVAAEAARKAGLTNIETQVVDVHDLDGEAESFDRVICRSGLMLFSGSLKVLRQIHRVLKRGGSSLRWFFRPEEKKLLSGDPFSCCAPSRRQNPTAFLARRPATASRRLPRQWLSRYHCLSSEPPTTFLICRRGHSRPQRDDFYSGEAMANLADAEREQAWFQIEQELGRRQGPDGLDLPGEMLIAIGTKKVSLARHSAKSCYSEWAAFIAKLEAGEHEFAQGRPAAFKALWSHSDDVSICGAFGGIGRGGKTWQPARLGQFAVFRGYMDPRGS